MEIQSSKILKYKKTGNKSFLMERNIVNLEFILKILKLPLNYFFSILLNISYVRSEFNARK